MLSRRLPTEDVVQALGIGPADKYNITIEQAFRKPADITTNGNLQRMFLDQVIFNTLIGNADAHAKNYSILLRPDHIALAPLYDEAPLALYPQYVQDLAMRIAGARQARAVGLSRWRKLAKRLGIDTDALSARVQKIAISVAEYNNEALISLESAQTKMLTACTGRNVEKALSEN